MILLYNTKKSLRGKLTKTLLKIIFLFVIFLNNSHANTSILILNSYHKGYALSDNILKGIEEVLYKDANIDVNILYMDDKRINSKEYFESIKKLYTVQLKNQEYDLIITIDDFAYKFILDNYKRSFNTVQSQLIYRNLPKDQAFYRFLLDEGVVNSSSTFQDVQGLLKDIAKGGDVVERVFGKMGKRLNKTYKGAQDLYVAEDDFFKIYNFFRRKYDFIFCVGFNSFY